MRTFIALELPPVAKSALGRSAAAAQKRWTAGKPTSQDNYHLTLVFLGEIAPERVSEVMAAMEACRSGRLTLTVGRFGRFRQRAGDVLWREVRGGNALFALQRRLSRELSDRGFSLEKREYAPHITLARKVRFPEGFPLEALAAGAEDIVFTPEGMTLLRSDPGPGGPVYTPLGIVSFER